MAEATVNVPAVGRVDRRYVYAAGAAAAAIVGYAYWRRSRQGTQAAASPTPDPATGSDTGSDAYTNPDPHSGGGSDAPGAPTTNVQWATAAVDALGSVGVEPGYAALVVGKYLARVALDADEQNVIRQAWALVGKPPEGNYSLVFPPSPPPPNPQPGPVPGPHLDLSAKARTAVTLRWSPVPGAASYKLDVIGGAWPAWSIVVDHYAGTSYQFTKVKPGMTYHFRARSYDAAGKPGTYGNVLGVIVPK